MGPPLSPSKVVLLAVHFAAHADIVGLTALLAQYNTILRPSILLRILLTHLPETLNSSAYVSLIALIACHELGESPTPAGPAHVNTSGMDDVSEQQADKKVKKLHLLPLEPPGTVTDGQQSHVTLFLLHRAYRVDQEVGLLTELPDLLTPFFSSCPLIRDWTTTTVLPLLRRNSQYYPHNPLPYSLLQFEQLADREAVSALLSQTGVSEEDNGTIGRDLRGMLGPWLRNPKRWRLAADEAVASGHDGLADVSCAGWDQFLAWLVAQPARSWKVAAEAIEQWGGPQDVDLGEAINLPPLEQSQQQYLETTYLRAAFASAYSISDSTPDALSGAFRICNKIARFLDQDETGSVEEAMADLPCLLDSDGVPFQGPKMTAHLRNNLLEASNTLTRPSQTSLMLLRMLVLSAFIVVRMGVSCNIRKAGDLAFIQDAREQSVELSKLLRSFTNKVDRNYDEYWVRARRDILWLRSWCKDSSALGDQPAKGILGMISKDKIETELLKAMLANSRYALAKALYDGEDQVLSLDRVRDAVQDAAFTAFDNATNPNRTRGGLKKCDEIIHALPKSVDKSLPMRKRIESLIKATHAISDYRLVLRQGEPFSPVVLRVHSDPVSIIAKVLEQNKGVYTRLPEFLEMGINMVHADLPVRGSSDRSSSVVTENRDLRIFVVEKRIVAMCIEAALAEDDFETAYSYVVNRLAPLSPEERGGAVSAYPDDWSWGAALRAGQYIRTAKSQQPTHLGTASGNLEIRHLEQRIECLATALRVAPASQLQEILKTFRRCEEQLESAVTQEAASEAEWDAAGDASELPGAFDVPRPRTAYPPRNMTATSAARQAEEAPMSLFDLSRATASVAQRNFSAFSSLRSVARGFSEVSAPGPAPQRVRKRDQFREAATGTLVSGVGWLIGANVNRDGAEAAR